MEQESGHTALFGSTEGAVTGCTRIPVPGNPEASSDAAARGCAGVMMVEQAGGKRRGYRKGSRSVTRPGHKDFETWKGSKRYSEKRLRKLIGRKTMRAPIFPFAGGKRRGYRKGSRSVSRPGHEDFETWKGSKMYDEKRLKKLIGRKTMRAPIFPFAGGQAKTNQIDISSAVGQASSVYDQLDAGQACSSQDNSRSQGNICNSMNSGPELTGGRRKSRRTPGVHRAAVDHDWDMESDHKGNLYYGGRRKRGAGQRGGYCQYGSDVAYGFGQSYGGVTLNASQSALANPVPYTPYSHCMKQ